MAIHTASPRRPFSNPLRPNSRVRAQSILRSVGRGSRRASPSLPARNRLSPRFTDLTVQRFNDPSPLGLSRVDYFKSTIINTEKISDVPVIKVLVIRTIQKSPKFRIIPLNSTSFRLLPPGGGGVKCRILYSHTQFTSPYVGKCRQKLRAVLQPLQRFNLRHSVTPLPACVALCRLMSAFFNS
jgi:hypothetical protein